METYDPISKKLLPVVAEKSWVFGHDRRKRIFNSFREIKEHSPL
jgi:hypothetical protein